MTDLREEIAVDLPAQTAQERILEYFDRRRSADGTLQIPLRVQLRDFGLPDNLALEHNVNVRIEKRRDAENLNDEIGVHWQAVEDGAFPAFDGRLIVWSEENPQESFIELEGRYEPPMGAVGRVFDASIGYLIAQRTAHELLQMLKKSICFP